jgi:hypothetical protein
MMKNILGSDFKGEIDIYDYLREAQIQYTWQTAAFFVYVENDCLTDEDADEILRITDLFVDDEFWRFCIHGRYLQERGQNQGK